MNEITFVTFNYGNAGLYVNGPGMCLVNFAKILKNSGYKVNIFSYLKSNMKDARPLRGNFLELDRAINRSFVYNHWSGIGSEFILANSLAKNSKYKPKILIGPNVIDTVEYKKEESFLNKIKFDKILTVNKYLKYKISKQHNINSSKIKEFLVGPDIKLWEPIDDCDETILWKGNSKQFVKDVNFALKLKDYIGGKYRFKFIGYPKPYNYFDHITEAKKSKIIIITSLSETMGLAMLEAWSSSVPSISHPKIYMHGENYKTGIITNKTIKDYSEAIEEIMENKDLYNQLKIGSRQYILDHFNDKNILSNYLKILGSNKW